MSIPREVITKSKLKRQGFSGAVEELCGPASIAMLLTMSGTSISVQEVVEKMEHGGAFVRGVGTILGKAPACFDAPLRYLPYIPTWLLTVLLKLNFGIAHSVKRGESGAGHIVCVYAYKDGMIYFCDPNQDDDNPRSVAAKEWRTLSKRRGLVIRMIQ